MRKTSHIARNYILCERLLQYGVLADTTAPTREGSDFNMSYSHAESPEAYATRLGLWLEDFGFDQAYRNRRIFFLHLVHGTHVLHVNAEAIPSGSFVQRCDGLVTRLHASPRWCSPSRPLTVSPSCCLTARRARPAWSTVAGGAS